MYADWFNELDSLLTAHRRWWQIRPFHHRDCYWRESAPELAQALDALSDNEIDALDADPQPLAQWLSPWIADGARLLALCELSPLPQRKLQIPERLDHGVPGRKWSQIRAFTASLPLSRGADLTAAPVLEWCAGKGHLGRLISACEQRPVSSLEWQQGLCEDGQALAARHGVDQHFIHGDAFAPESAALLETLLGAEGQALALHACGDLHMTLMRHWAAGQAETISLSPCCYHLIRGQTYVPMSAAVGKSALALEKADLQLPLQQTVTAGAHVRRLREQELRWRLAFDELQREVRGIDEYLPVPNIRKSQLSGSFTEFVGWVAGKKQLAEAAFCSAAVAAEGDWLARGEQRLQAVKRMELVVHLFRRPLEIWLVLDRVLYLQEQGARVSLGTFCDTELTPRNILLHGDRSVQV